MPTREDFRARACRHLRAKTMYLFLDEQHDRLQGEESTLQYWCNRTMGCNGPDRGFVHFEDCGPRRECFEREA